MRVSGRALVLGVLVAVCAPGVAAGAPIVPTACDSAVAATSCSLVRIADPFSPSAFEGEFLTAGDVLLFSFRLDEDAQFSALTTSFGAGNFDPTLALYDGGGSILQLPDPSGPGTTIPARYFDIDLDGQNYDDQIDITLAAGEYLLALVFGNPPDSIFGGGFDCGSCEFAGAGTAFALSLGASSLGGTEPVPEPGTLTLMAGGAAAGWLQRRRAKRRRTLADLSR